MAAFARLDATALLKQFVVKLQAAQPESWLEPARHVITRLRSRGLLRAELDASVQEWLGVDWERRAEAAAAPRAVGARARRRSSERADGSRSPRVAWPVTAAREKLSGGVATAAQFRAARAALRAAGVDELRAELEAGGVVDADGRLATEAKGGAPFNPFARLVAGLIRQQAMDGANAALDAPAAERFLLACNPPEQDAQWASASPPWLGKASMGARHRFLLLRDLDWSWFNVLVFGMRDGAQLAEAVATLEAMREAALAYTRADGGWSASVGLYLHCYPLNSVQALHLHIVDLAAVGPTHEHLSHKNLPLDAALEVLREEMSAPPVAAAAAADAVVAASPGRGRGRARAARAAVARRPRRPPRPRPPPRRWPSRLTSSAARQEYAALGGKSSNATKLSVLLQKCAAAGVRVRDGGGGGARRTQWPRRPRLRPPQRRAVAVAAVVAVSRVAARGGGGGGVAGGGGGDRRAASAARPLRAVGSAPRACYRKCQRVTGADAAAEEPRIGGGPRRDGRAHRSDVGADGAGERRRAAAHVVRTLAHLADRR